MELTAIVYTSATGFTQRHAALLAERLRLPFYELDQALAHVKRGGSVLYLGWICAGSVKGLKKALARYRVQGVCAVGMTPEGQMDPAKLARQCRLGGLPLFYLRGGYAPQRLSGMYKLMMAPMAKAVGKAPADTDADRAMQAALVQGGDWVSEEALAPVLSWLEAAQA